MKALTSFIRNYSYLVFFPLLVVTIIGWIVIPFLKPYLKEVIAFGLMSVSFFGVYLLFTGGRVQKLVLIILTFILAILAFIKLSFYYHYGVKLSISALFVIFETNAQESTEFLSYYLNLWTIGLALLLFFPVIAAIPFILKLKRDRDNLKGLNSWKIKILISLIVCASVFVIYKKFSEQNIIYTGLTSYTEYNETKTILKKTLAKKESEYIKVFSSLEMPQTYVVIIGESTSRWHMQLYGYPRETNPLLSEIKQELFVFDNVITPNVHTILALDKILTLSDYNTPNKEKNASIVQLANQAGFKTYWLSNQRPVGLHESMSTLIGYAVTEKYFLATDNYTSNIYDEDLLPKLEEILHQEDTKKMIFIHLIGTHSDYKKRYPDSFKYFKEDPPQTKFTNSANNKVINEYDNAVRYNDFIVRNIIEKVRKEKTMSYVVYFSDHGDEVYDTMDLMGHNEYFATPPMYEIPFIVWASPKYKQQRPNFADLNLYSNRKYNLEDFIYSYSDLSGIEFNLSDSTKSIFAPSFKERTRWIKKEEDYDNR